MEAVFGQGSGLDLIKTLHFPRTLGMVNSTMRPSSLNNSVTLEYSGSVIALADRFPCIKLR